MKNGFGWDRLPKSFMAGNTVFLLLTALIRNFYKAIIHRLDVKRFGLNATSRIKAFVFRFISVPAKWIRTSSRYVLNIYTCNNAYADVFSDRYWITPITYGYDIAYCLKLHCGVRGGFRLSVQITCKFSNESTCTLKKDVEGISCGFEVYDKKSPLSAVPQNAALDNLIFELKDSASAFRRHI